MRLHFQRDLKCPHRNDYFVALFQHHLCTQETESRTCLARFVANRPNILACQSGKLAVFDWDFKIYMPGDPP